MSIHSERREVVVVVVVVVCVCVCVGGGVEGGWTVGGSGGEGLKYTRYVLGLTSKAKSVTSFMLSLLKRAYCKRKALLPLTWSKCFPLRVDSFSEGRQINFNRIIST